LMTELGFILVSARSLPQAGVKNEHEDVFQRKTEIEKRKQGADERAPSPCNLAYAC
jgi:hypothetical protein